MNKRIKKTPPADTGSADKKGTSPSTIGQWHEDPSHFENQDNFSIKFDDLQGGGQYA